MDDAPTILLRWCKQRSGIRLRRDFLQSWKDQRQSPITDTETAYRELVADFLCKDLSICSEPVIPENFGENPLDTFPPSHLRQGGGVVLQIQDTNDISNSTFSLLSSLNEGGNLSRGLLRWTLTDGMRQVQAMEMETIPNLNLKTPFGCKLLVQNCQVKRGMLLLTKNSIKVMGGQVPQLYGGNMMNELETRFKMKLGLIKESTTPIPEENSNSNNTSNRSNNANASNRSTNTNTNNNATNTNSNNRSSTTYSNNGSNNNNTSYNIPDTFDTSNIPPSSHDPQLIDELNELNDIDMDQFDDADFDIMELEQQPQLPQKNIPSIPDDDDDFVMTQPPPRPRPSLSTSKKLNTSSPVRDSSSRPTKRIREEKSIESMDASIVKKEKVTEVEEEVHWISWSDQESDDEDVQLDEKGRAHITFHKLFEVLTAMDKNTYTGKIADTVVVKAKFMRLAKIKYSTLSGFYVIFDIASPTEPNTDIVKVVVSHKLFVELLKLEPEVLADMPNLMKNKSAIRKIIVPFESNMKTKLAELEIDLSLTEKALTENGQDANQIVAPCQSYTFIK